jgi:hypothetical protein
VKRTLGESLSLVALTAVAVGAGMVLAGCSSDADVVSKNLSKDADNFKVNRRIVFYNGITGDYILSIEGFCSVAPQDPTNLTVTCKVGDSYLKHYLGRSDNVTWFGEQLDARNVSPDHYRVIFKPSVIVPDIEGR